MFIAMLFTIAKIRKQPKCPSIDEWIKKMSIYLFIYGMECYPAMKRNEILTLVTTQTDPEGIVLSEMSQTDGDAWPHFRVHSKNKPCEQNRNRPMERTSRWLPKERGV